MKYIIILLMLQISLGVFAQNSDTIANDYCNDKWLEELIKHDTIYEKNRKQDYLCYLGIFDSLEKGKKHSKADLYLGIGRLIKYSDGAFAGSLSNLAYELFKKDPKTFFYSMKYVAKDTDYEYWAWLLYYESCIHFREDIKPYEIIEKLNIDEMLKSKKEYHFLEKYIYIHYAEHIKK